MGAMEGPTGGSDWSTERPQHEERIKLSMIGGGGAVDRAAKHLIGRWTELNLSEENLKNRGNPRKNGVSMRCIQPINKIPT